jgi:uncharacterized membrane protein
MDYGGPDFGGMFTAIAGITVLMMVFITVAVIAVVVWAIRRAGPMRDPAEQELRARLARGEIDMAEFDVRLRALHERDGGT